MQEAENDSDLSPGQKKWFCDYCTYENWGGSSKCTMCRGPRPIRSGQNIFSAVPSPGQPEIYRINYQQEEVRGQETPQHVDLVTGKWACVSCTYYNYPKSIRCTQCLTPKRKVSSPAVSPSPRLSPLTLPPGQQATVNTANRANAIRSLAAGDKLADQLTPLHISCPTNKSPGILPSPESCKELANSSSPTSNQDKQQGSTKWNCLVCTYENWPKATNCVLCGGRRGRSSPDAHSQHIQNVVASNRDSVARDSPSPEGASMRREGRGRRDIIDLQSPVNIPAGGSGGAAGKNNLEYEKRLRQLRRRMRETDWAWLSACMGVVEGDSNPVEAYLNSGGDLTRKLTHPESTLLGRPGVYDQGHTLVHLAVKFHREDLLATLLSQMESITTRVVKRVPSYVAPDLAAAIRRQLALSLRQRKGPVPCFYLADIATYTLPPELEDLPQATQDQLLNELMDQDVQAELEREFVINWSAEVTTGLTSRLSALWNRSAGDCLLDAVLQASWGVFDRDNTLRRAISDSLHEAGHIFYPRWKEWEQMQAQELDFTLAESQWAEEWAGLLALASQPGESLEQLHVFCLAHVLRRPICVYGVKYVKSWRGENLGYAKFEGVYLPLLWDPSFCDRSPLALGYTRGHFSALVPPEPDTAGCGGAGGGVDLGNDQPGAARSCFLPLMARDRSLLPVHFLTNAESGRDEEIMRDWMDVLVTESGLLVAQQTIQRPPLLVAQMTEEWLNYYRKIAQQTSSTQGQSRSGPNSSSNMIRSTLESSEESDE